MKRKQPEQPVGAAVTQLRGGQGHPFGSLKAYVPLCGTEFQLYRSMREALPVLDAAITKLVRLVGGFTVTCPQGQEGLQHFLQTVP